MSVIWVMSVIIMRVFSEMRIFSVIVTITLIRVMSVICAISVMWAMSVTEVNLVIGEIPVTRAVISKKKGKRIFKGLKISVIGVISTTSIKKQPFEDVLQNRCT